MFSDEPITRLDLGFDINVLVLDNVPSGDSIAGFGQDGLPDGEDSKPEPEPSGNVVINACDYGVGNKRETYTESHYKIRHRPF